MIRENMLKNHGYYKVTEDGVEQCLISCDDGVYRFTPPESEEQDWTVEKLVDEAASDAVLVDLDRDGEKELILISPFHGGNIFISIKRLMETTRRYILMILQILHMRSMAGHCLASRQ